MTDYAIDLRPFIFDLPEFRGQKMAIRQALANELCCHPNTLMNWLTDPSTMPADKYLKLCVILNIKLEYAFPDLRSYKQRLVPLVKDYLRSPHVEQKEIEL
jgi:hypothetical protein